MACRWPAFFTINGNLNVQPNFPPPYSQKVFAIQYLSGKVHTGLTYFDSVHVKSSNGQVFFFLGILYSEANACVCVHVNAIKCIHICVVYM